MRKGEPQQVDRPEQLFEHPLNLFGATFVGSPAMNLMQAEVVARDGAIACRVGSQELTFPDGEWSPELRGYAGRSGALGVRPEHLRTARGHGAASGTSRLRGEVLVTELLGTEALVHLQLDARPVVTDEVLEVAADIDEGAMEELPKEAAHAAMTTVLARVDARDRPRPGDTVEVMVEARDLRFFDLASGRAIGGGSDG